MDIPGALSGVSTALTIVKQLNDIDRRVDEAGFKLKIAEATGALAEAKLGLVDAQEDIRSKDAEISSLRASFKRRDETVERFGYRYRCDASKEPIGTAFCPICMEDGHFVLTIRLEQSGRPYACPKCKANFGFISAFHDPG
ncbi:hypothetical protein AB9E28_24835 [Rhizobium leguminosarum]|uniref:hypothetical protein n=1 Tax=Rhizobium leguminosarum TaxID=384 RepID=UPI003F9CAABD